MSSETGIRARFNPPTELGRDSRSAKLVQSRPVSRLFSSFPPLVRNDTWNTRRRGLNLEGGGGCRDMRIMGIEVGFEGRIG